MSLEVLLALALAGTWAGFLWFLFEHSQPYHIKDEPDFDLTHRWGKVRGRWWGDD